MCPEVPHAIHEVLSMPARLTRNDDGQWVPVQRHETGGRRLPVPLLHASIQT